MFTRAGRIAAAGCVVIVACAALARCGGPMRSPTEPEQAATSTPGAAASPTPTPPSPVPSPVPANGGVFGYVSTVSGGSPHGLPNVLLRLQQAGAADQLATSGSGSPDGYYSFCCLRFGPAVITATLAGYVNFTAAITVGQSPVRHDIQMTLIAGGGAPPPFPLPEPIPSDARSRNAAVDEEMVEQAFSSSRVIPLW
jgi:hypothetical protein